MNYSVWLLKFATGAKVATARLSCNFTWNFVCPWLVFPAAYKCTYLGETDTSKWPRAATGSYIRQTFPADIRFVPWRNNSDLRRDRIQRTSLRLQHRPIKKSRDVNETINYTQHIYETPKTLSAIASEKKGHKFTSTYLSAHYKVLKYMHLHQLVYWKNWVTE